MKKGNLGQVYEFVNNSTHKQFPLGHEIQRQ